MLALTIIIIRGELHEIEPSLLSLLFALLGQYQKRLVGV